MRITNKPQRARAAAIAITSALCGKRSFFALAMFVYHLVPMLISWKKPKNHSTSSLQCHKAPWIVVGGVGRHVNASHMDCHLHHQSWPWPLAELMVRRISSGSRVYRNIFASQNRHYRSLPGKRPWALYHTYRFSTYWKTTVQCIGLSRSR